MISRVRGVTSGGELVRVQPEAVLLADGNGHGRRADEAGHRLVDREARVRVDDLVALLAEGHDGVEHDRLGARCHHDLLHGHRKTLPAGGIGARSPRAGPAGRAPVRSASSLRRSPVRRRPGCWPGCRSPARRSRGGSRRGRSPRGRAPVPPRQTRSPCRDGASVKRDACPPFLKRPLRTTRTWSRAMMQDRRAERPAPFLWYDRPRDDVLRHRRRQRPPDGGA